MRNYFITRISNAVTELDLITEFNFFLIARGFNTPRYFLDFAFKKICNGFGMQPEDAFSCGHLVLSHFGTCLCANVETNLSLTCLLSVLLIFEHPSDYFYFTFIATDTSRNFKENYQKRVLRIAFWDDEYFSWWWKIKIIIIWFLILTLLRVVNFSRRFSFLYSSTLNCSNLKSAGGAENLKVISLSTASFWYVITAYQSFEASIGAEKKRKGKFGTNSKESI